MNYFHLSSFNFHCFVDYFYRPFYSTATAAITTTTSLHNLNYYDDVDDEGDDY